MIAVKLCPPDGILPGGWQIVEWPAVPRKGDEINVYQDGEHYQLVVTKVRWAVLYGRADLPEVLCDRAEDVGDDDLATVDYYDADWNKVGSERAAAKVRVQHEPLTIPANDPLGAAIIRAISDDPNGTAAQIMALVGDQFFHLSKFTRRGGQLAESEWTPAPDFSKCTIPVTTERT